MNVNMLDADNLLATLAALAVERSAHTHAAFDTR
jgi:hypothetical protein